MSALRSRRAIPSGAQFIQIDELDGVMRQVLQSVYIAEAVVFLLMAVERTWRGPQPSRTLAAETPHGWLFLIAANLLIVAVFTFTAIQFWRDGRALRDAKRAVTPAASEAP